MSRFRWLIFAVIGFTSLFAIGCTEYDGDAGVEVAIDEAALAIGRSVRCNNNNDFNDDFPGPTEFGRWPREPASGHITREEAQRRCAAAAESAGRIPTTTCDPSNCPSGESCKRDASRFRAHTNNITTGQDGSNNVWICRTQTTSEDKHRLTTTVVCGRCARPVTTQPASQPTARTSVFGREISEQQVDVQDLLAQERALDCVP